MTVFTKILRSLGLGLGLMAATLFADALLGTTLPGGPLTPEAHARLGRRPATRVSVAGAARRTTRRRIHRTTVFVATLPRGCTTVDIDGTILNQCGGTYYQPSGSQWVVVNVE